MAGNCPKSLLRVVQPVSRLRVEVINAGGGFANSVSLAEFSDVCAGLTGARLDICSEPTTRTGNISVYITDNTRMTERFGRSPQRTVNDIARDLHAWASAHADDLRAALT